MKIGKIRRAFDLKANKELLKEVQEK